jgi:hypothetical protein
VIDRLDINAAVFGLAVSRAIMYDTTTNTLPTRDSKLHKKVDQIVNPVRSAMARRLNPNESKIQLAWPQLGEKTAILNPSF